MTLAVPTHLVDTMGTLTATGVEAAGHLLHEVGSAVSHAAVATTDRARSWTGLGRRRRSLVGGRNLLVLGALVGLVAVVVLGRRSKQHGTTTPATARPASGSANNVTEPATTTDDDSQASAAAS